MDDYLGILRRRVWALVIPTIVITIATFLVLLKIPNRYTSTTLVLIEEQRVPDAIVRSNVTGELNQRLASMQEQILSRTRLQPIVERFSLFNDGLPMEDRVTALRSAIAVSPVEPMALSQSRQLPGFRVSVSLNDPKLAQEICSEITSLFQSEELHSLEQQTQGITDFLARQVADAKQHLDDQDSAFAEFKGKHFGEMPEEQQGNLNILMSLNTQLEGVNQALSRAQQDKTFTQTMLDQQIAAAKTAPVTTIGPQSDEQQLKEWESSLAKMRAQYSDDWPDVKALKTQVEQLKKKIAQDGDSVSAGDAASTTAKTTGNKTEPAGSPASPDSAKNKPAGASVAPSPREPFPVQQLRTQLYLVDQQIREKMKQQEDLQKEIRTYEGRVRMSPTVEQEYKQVTRDHQTALDFYNDLLKKRDTSSMATDMERRQQGETFTILDPASLPAKPSYPNRPVAMGLGLAGGLVLGFLLVLLIEFRDKSLWGEQDVEALLQLPTLAMVPLIQNDANGASRTILRLGKSKPAVQAGT
jgi:polysaccharide chain length determinant protein (PEP-CTERM system associated)